MIAAHVAGLTAGMLADAAFADPKRGHPVAGYGRAATRLEQRLYGPDRRAGARFAAVAVGVPVAAALAAQAATRRRPVARAVLVAVATWAVVGGTSLRREATAMAAELDAATATTGPVGVEPVATGALDPQSTVPPEVALKAARERLPNLCGRDPSALDAGEIARATVESVAENTSDAVVAPLFWGAVAGLPGLVGYRAVNTLDAMVGHRSERYRDFGTAAARLDDAANLVPARLTAALTVVAAPLVPDVSGRRGPARSALGALVAWARYGRRHPSPNAGQCEAAMAGALGVRLGGRNVYHGRSEVRPYLGRGPLPGPAEVRRAARISGAVGVAALAACVTGRVLVTRRGGERA
ncbi:MAG TPA: CobD/CbiB family cobalamin biosynthesis protein [Micromonosporaceae bacterium]|nr:CobD/CbiB family cobalamin biosynthesis protein [Micromonosporaceae bacterium]